MPSDADRFESSVNRFAEFVDDEGRHFYVVQFEDGSGRVFRKQPSEGGHSMAEFVVRPGYAMEAMRRIGAVTDFEVDEGKNTQQNLRNLMGGS